MEKYQHIFYSIVGPHAGETVETIVARKKAETINGFSLWSAKIDRKSLAQVWNLNPETEVYVLCHESKKATDPASSESATANMYWYDNNGKIELKVIPESISTTYPTGKNYQAYVVSDYIILDGNVETYDFADYVTTLTNGSKKTYTERFKSSFFQNVYGKLDENRHENGKTKDIFMVMKLKYPFVVLIDGDRNT